MNIKLYKKFIQELINEGVKVQDLTLKQISKSIELYRVVNKI